MPAALLDTNAVSDLVRDHPFAITHQAIFAQIPGLLVEDWTH